MAVTVIRLPDEPIIVARITEQMSVPGMRTMFNESALLCAGLPDTVYRVIDLLEADASINELARTLVEGKRRVRGSVLDPRIVSVLVARPNRIRFIADILAHKEFGGLTVPVFDSVDEALVYLRAEITRAHDKPAAV